MPGRGTQLSIFDRFAEAASALASRAVFFIACTLLVVLWLPSYFIVRNVNTWQLVINTLTTIVTFLLVALLQNSQRRGEQAVQQKLDALAEGLADFMVAMDADSGDRAADIDKLRKAVGAEQR